MTEKKLTKMDKFRMLMDVEGVKSNDVLAEFVAGLMADLEKRYANRGPSKAYMANEAILQPVLDFMIPGEAYSISSLIKGVTECAELSNQRVSAVLRIGVDKKLIERVVKNRQAYFVRVGD